MQTIQTFDFATVICDGCACRRDSYPDFDDVRLLDYADLVEWKLEDADWLQVDEDDDDKWLCPLCAKDPSHRTHLGEGRIIVEERPLFGLRCDLCGKLFEDSDGFSCWGDDCTPYELAPDYDWMELSGKWYCPDCHRTCDPMQDCDEEPDWEEKYCKKCPYEHDCNESVPREKPMCSDECKHAVEGEGGKWKRCPHYHTHDGKTYTPDKCTLAEDGGKECPRVAWWRDKGRAEQESKNAAALKECNIKEG